MILLPLPSYQVASTSHHTPRAPHSRDQHGLVLSVWRKGEEIEKLAKVGNQSQVEHSGYPRHWGSPSSTQGQKREGPSGITQTVASSHLTERYARVSSSIKREAGQVEGKGSFTGASLEQG